MKEKLWMNLEMWLDRFFGNERIILIGDMHAKVGYGRAGDTLGAWRVPGVNDIDCVENIH